VNIIIIMTLSDNTVASPLRKNRET